MLCPVCGTKNSVVKETRLFREVFTRRARVCFNNHPFTTYEGVEMPQLDKAKIKLLQDNILAAAAIIKDARSHRNPQERAPLKKASKQVTK